MEETRHTVWSEVSNVLKILDFPFEKRLIDHISSLQKSTDLILMESLLEVYEDNQPLVKVLSDLSDWDRQIELPALTLPHSFVRAGNSSLSSLTLSVSYPYLPYLYLVVTT